MSVEYIDGVFFRGVVTSKEPFATYDSSANEVLISQAVLNELTGLNAEKAMTSLIYLVNDLKLIQEDFFVRKGEVVRITKKVAVDAQGRVVIQPESRPEGLMLSPMSLQNALESLLADINSGIKDDTLLSRFIALRQRREEWTPVMNGIDGLLEVIEARLRQ